MSVMMHAPTADGQMQFHDLTIDDLGLVLSTFGDDLDTYINLIFHMATVRDNKNLEKSSSQRTIRSPSYGYLAPHVLFALLE